MTVRVDDRNRGDEINVTNAKVRIRVTNLRAVSNDRRSILYDEAQVRVCLCKHNGERTNASATVDHHGVLREIGPWEPCKSISRHRQAAKEGVDPDHA